MQRTFTVLALALLLTARVAHAQWQHQEMLDPGDPDVAQSATGGQTAGGEVIPNRHFPTSGTINALVVFVQYEDDKFEHCGLKTDDRSSRNYNPNCTSNNPAFESWTDNSETEWPAYWSKGSNPTGEIGRLPMWAEGQKLLAAPGTAPGLFPKSSMSEYYRLVSSGQLTVTGHVYPKVIFLTDPDSILTTQQWYSAPQNYAPFENGAVRATHDILTNAGLQAFVNSNPAGTFDNAGFQTASNRVGLDFGDFTNVPDGKFDMIIVHFRFSGLSSLAGGVHALGQSYTALTSLGSNTYDPLVDSYSPAPVTLGGLQVVDNLINGSGVITAGRTSLQFAALMAHEIGHRQLKYEHFGNDDTYALMNDKVLFPMFSLGERLMLGWIQPSQVQTVDVNALQPNGAYTLNDAYAPGATFTRAVKGSPGNGDVYIEARRRSNFWLADAATWYAANGTRNADGDQEDVYLFQEGAYVYKRALLGNAYEYRSMENTGTSRSSTLVDYAIRHGSRFGYAPSDSYNPLTKAFFGFPSNLIDLDFGFDNVMLTPGGISVRLWRGFLTNTVPNSPAKELGFGATFQATQAVSRTSNRTWDMAGTFINRGPLYVPPGTTFNLDPGTTIASYGPITVAGTPTNKVTFKRRGSSAWQEVTLLADGNTFQNVVLDGGVQNLTVASRNNTFQNVRSKNGWRGLSTWWTPAGQRSSYTLINSVVEANTTVGMVTQYADATIVNSAIEFNGEAGLYFYQGTGYGLHGNRISANGYNAPRSGIELYAGSVATTNLYGNEGGGLNRIASNAKHEVQLDASSSAYLGSGDYTDDQNAILDPAYGPGGVNKLVYNGSSWTVFAEGNYWGVQGTPDPGYFYGPVQYFDFPLSSDPTTGRTPGSGAPSAAATGDVLLFGGGAESLAAGPPSEPTRGLRARVDRLRERLAERPDADDAARTLADLYALTHLGADDATGARGVVGELLVEHRARLGGADAARLTAPARAAAETALYLSVADAARAERYDEAEALLAGESAVGDPALRRALGHHRLALLTRAGDWAGAEALVGRLRADGGDDAALAFALGEIGHQRGREKADAAPAVAGSPDAPARTTTSVGPPAFAVSVWPNPSSGRATFRYVLPEAARARVEVYDALGRRVAVLADDDRAAGAYEATFEADGLATGLYVYRVTAGRHVKTGTVVLVR